jgi:hypothetical protein
MGTAGWEGAAVTKWGWVRAVLAVVGAVSIFRLAYVVVTAETLLPGDRWLAAFVLVIAAVHMLLDTAIEAIEAND